MMKAFSNLQIVCFLTIFLATSWNCTVLKAQKGKASVQIRIVNDTEEQFTHVSLFSMKFKDLMEKDTTEYKELKYDSLKHDPLIYAINKGMNYGRYVEIPEDGAGHYTYTIDSLRNRLIYVSLKKSATR